MNKKVSYGKLIVQRLLGLVLATALSAGCGAAMEGGASGKTEDQSVNQSADKAEAKSMEEKSTEIKSTDTNSADQSSKLKLCVTTSFLEDMAEETAWKSAASSQEGRIPTPMSRSRRT